MLIVYIKDFEVCECSIQKSGWGGHLTTRKHGIACGDIVVEEVEKQCWKCRGHKVLEMFRGDNATCSGCLAHRKKWAGNKPHTLVRELSRKYGEEHKEEKKETIKNTIGGK